MDILTLGAILKNLRCLEVRESWTRRELEAHQAQALSELRRYTYTLSPFYQAFHRGLENSPLHELPILTKSLLMENFDSLVTNPSIRLDGVREHLQNLKGDERYLNRYWVNATSGTTGQPGIFLYDRAEWAMTIASSLRGLQWGGWELHFWQSRKEAVVASGNLQHMSMRVALSAQKPWTIVLSLAASEPIENIVAELNRFQPDFLVVYAATARLLAEEQKQGRLKIRPKAIFTTAEVLTAESRKKIEAVWGNILFNQYAATEAGTMAAEYPQQQGLALFEDLCIFEIVDENNQAVPAGTYGEKLLITVLFKHVQPLIRYEISDSLCLAEGESSAHHPFRLIDGIQGRREDILYLPSKKGGKVAVHPNIFHEVMDSLPLRAWQLVQTEQGIQIFLQGLGADFSDMLLLFRLEEALMKQAVAPIPLDIQRVNSIPTEASGKVVLIKALKN